MNTMTMERIKNEVAREVFAGTKYDWVDMLDQTAEQDRQAIRMSEEDSRAFWKEYFEDLLDAVIWSDDQDPANDTIRTYGFTRTHLQLSDAAQKVYNETDPLQIVEIESGGGSLRYNLSGCIEATGISADEVEDLLISFGEE